MSEISLEYQVQCPYKGIFKAKIDYFVYILFQRSETVCTIVVTSLCISLQSIRRYCVIYYTLFAELLVQGHMLAVAKLRNAFNAF